MAGITRTTRHGGMLRGTRFNPLNIVRQGKPVLLQQPPAGTYVYRYSFTSGRGDWATRQAWRSGMQFNTPPIPVQAANDVGPKSLPSERSFLSLDAPNVVVTALKVAMPIAIVGAIIGEWFGTQGGLGPVMLAAIEQSGDVRVVEAGEDLSLVTEAADDAICVHAALENFDRDPLLKRIIIANAKVDSAHAAMAELGN